MKNLDRLMSSIAGTLNVPVDIVDESSNRDNILQWDSLAMVNLITELETVFKVQFDILEIAEFHSVEIIKLTLEEKGVCFSE